MDGQKHTRAALVILPGPSTLIVFSMFQEVGFLNLNWNSFVNTVWRERGAEQQLEYSFSKSR